MQLAFDFVVQLDYTVIVKKDGKIINHPTPAKATFVSTEQALNIKVAYLKEFDADEIEINILPVLIREYAWK